MEYIKVCLMLLFVSAATAQDQGDNPSHGDIVTLVGSSGRFECGASPNINVRFNTIMVSSGSVYRRKCLRLHQLEFVTTDGVQLTASSFVACAEAVDQAGYPAFEFDGSCTAHNLMGAAFSKCDYGCDKVLYLRGDSFAEEGSVVNVPLEAAPYISGDLANSRLYSLVDLSYTEENIPWTSNFTYADSYYNWASYLTSQNGTQYAIHYHFLDIPSCLSNSLDGMPILVSPVVYGRVVPILYILNECGKTLSFSDLVNDPSTDEVVFYSHAGLGCVDFPMDEAIDCTVTIKHDNPLTVRGFQMNFVEDDNTCGGLTVEGGVVLSPDNTGTEDLCSVPPPYIATPRFTEPELVLIVRGQTSARKIGFSGYVKEFTAQ